MEIQTKTKTILYLNDEEKELIKKCCDICITDNLLSKCLSSNDLIKLSWLRSNL